MIRRRTISTLFPYTTLFRSALRKQKTTHCVPPYPHSGNHPIENDLKFLLKAAMFGSRDRKSTRLNSSHSSISYAVFCLKKKTNQAHMQSFIASGLLHDGITS